MSLSNSFLKNEKRVSYADIEKMLEHEKSNILLNSDHDFSKLLKIEFYIELFKKISKIIKKCKRYILSKPDAILHYSEFDAVDYQRFVNQAYLKLLGRYPDTDGLDSNVRRLQSGWKRADILFLLLHSEEALYRNIKIKNFYWHFVLDQCKKMPIAGRLLEILVILIRLPTLITRLRLDLETLRSERFDTNQIDELQEAISVIENKMGITSRLLQGDKQDLYLQFENNFRGSQAIIKKRQKFYLSFLKKSDSNKNTPILDVGCGRGEWLGVLKDAGYSVLGIDTNSEMIQASKEKGIQMEVAEANNFLSYQSDESFLAVTAFHVVEHMFFDDLVLFLQQAYSKTVKGGAIILETPNPENLIVGGCNFYMDPTHKRQLPPLLLEFLVKTVGFKKTKIVYPFDREKMKSNNEQLNDFYNSHIGISPDYAIIGYK